MKARALLLINKRSRNGEGLAEKARLQLERVGIESVYRECPPAQEVSALITRESSAVDFIVIGGGDGTLNAAAEGVMAAGKPLAILPTGTANDLARTLEIPETLEDAIAVIGEGAERWIDVGSVNEKLFFNVASVGLSAELAKELTAEAKSFFGKLGYAFAGIKVLSRARPFHAKIVNGDNHVSVWTLQIAVGNGRFYGGGNIVAADARIDDAQLHLYSLELLRAWRLMLMLPAFRTGEHGAWAEVRELKDHEFEIWTRRPRPVNADGEIVTHTPAIFRVIPKAIRVLVPRSSTAWK